MNIQIYISKVYLVLWFCIAGFLPAFSQYDCIWVNKKQKSTSYCSYSQSYKDGELLVSGAPFGLDTLKLTFPDSHYLLVNGDTLFYSYESTILYNLFEVIATKKSNKVSLRFSIQSKVNVVPHSWKINEVVIGNFNRVKKIRFCKYFD